MTDEHAALLSPTASVGAFEDLVAPQQHLEALLMDEGGFVDDILAQITTMQTHANDDRDDDNIDETQLLAEADELLHGLDPMAFVEDPVVVPPDAIAVKTEQRMDSSYAATAADYELVVQPTTTTNNRATKTSRRKGSKPGSMRNLSRERLQQELVSLRSQVVVLEKDLQSIQDTKMCTQQFVIGPAWERIAKRQLHRRERTETENKRLKAMVEAQKALVVDVEETLFQWQLAAPTPLGIHPQGSQMTHHPKTVRLEPGDEVLLEMFISELDAVYSRLNETFQDAGLHCLGAEPFSSVKVKTKASSTGTQRSFFELTDVETCPFDFERVNQVAWICSKRLALTCNAVEYERLSGRDDVMAVKHRVKRVHNGIEVYCHMMFALKQFTLKDRSINVWRGMFKGEQHFPDSFVQETGWLVSSALPSPNSDDGTSKEVGSVTKCCVHLEPKRFQDPAACLKAETDVMTNLVIASYDEDLREMEQMMENMLLDEIGAAKKGENKLETR